MKKSISFKTFLIENSAQESKMKCNECIINTLKEVIKRNYPNLAEDLNSFKGTLLNFVKYRAEIIHFKELIVALESLHFSSDLFYKKYNSVNSRIKKLNQILKYKLNLTDCFKIRYLSKEERQCYRQQIIDSNFQDFVKANYILNSIRSLLEELASPQEKFIDRYKFGNEIAEIDNDLDKPLLIPLIAYCNQYVVPSQRRTMLPGQKFDADEIGWRPTDSVPEDHYAL